VIRSRLAASSSALLPVAVLFASASGEPGAPASQQPRRDAAFDVIASSCAAPDSHSDNVPNADRCRPTRMDHACCVRSHDDGEGIIELVSEAARSNLVAVPSFAQHG
jgi:hypothetical protein